MRVRFFVSFCVLISVFNLNARVIQTDICIYGGTSAGVISAVSADRLGKKTLIIEPSNHLGGLSVGGLGETDIGNKYAVTGISRDFYRELGKYYGEFEMWKFEPHVAENLFLNYLSKTKAEIIKGYLLKSVTKVNARIEEIEIVKIGDKNAESIVIKANMFIDATYEGDLLAKAGVSFTLGRESNSTYNETINGVQLKENHQFPDNINPYIRPNDPNSGYVYGVSNNMLLPNGTGDKLMQAYNYRLCLTKNKDNQLPIIAPTDYEPSKYELLRRLFAKRNEQKWTHLLKSYLIINEMPNGKTDINNMGPFSTDLIGGNYNYIESDYDTRKKIEIEHANYIKGLLYFLANDSSVPDELSAQMRKWGYAKDEFTDNGGFPHQIYVREGRRMIGEYVMTEKNCVGKEKVADGIGLAAYTMDSHNCQRIVVNGMVKNEGDVQIGGFPPYPISYRSIVPKRNECTNLLVPVCLSASHIAYGSIRMEPVFMVLAQTVAVAASMAIDRKCDVQKINVTELQTLLLKNPLLNGTKPEVLVDNSDLKQVKIAGNWEISKQKHASYKMDYLLTQSNGNSTESVTFFPKLVHAGMYEVYFYCPEKPTNSPEWAESVTVKIFDGKTAKNLTVNQKIHSHHWVKLGEFNLASNKKPYVEVVADKTGVAIADAFIFVPKK